MVRKCIAITLVVLMIMTMVGCNKNSVNYIIENEPSVTGIVTEVHEKYIQIYIENEGYLYGADCNVSLDVKNGDGLYSPITVGDEVVVYFNGSISESYPLQIHTVYAITLKTPA